MNECKDDNGGCEHACRDTPHDFECSCNTGYSLNNDGFNCTGMKQYKYTMCIIIIVTLEKYINFAFSGSIFQHIKLIRTVHCGAHS